MKNGSRVSLRKTIGLIGIVVFGLFALVQFNDPDPELWIVLYGYAAFLNAWSLRHSVQSLAFFGLVAYGICLLIWSPDFSSGWIDVETAREAAGVLLCLVWTNRTSEFPEVFPTLTV